MKWLSFILDFLADETRHFWLASACGLWAALAGFFLMSIMWCVASFAGWIASQRAVVVFTILICLGLLALSAALLSHYWLDYFVVWYNMPLGPALDLETNRILKVR